VCVNNINTLSYASEPFDTHKNKDKTGTTSKPMIAPITQYIDL